MQDTVTIRRIPQGEAMILVVEETRLDDLIALPFKEAVVRVLEDGHVRIVMDLGAVEFIDSSGLGALVTCRKILGARGEIVLTGIASSVTPILTITRMDKVFRTFPTIEAAVAALQS